ncbi:hypothetical protein [Zavarzinella formosa]|uniref:hypothetical protein n=1 Tax=Zavarzinella formosa TaxID=360055 RepID=UPI0012F94648|nr:hypothetical protein [Zavarzinella formosa]
MTKPRRCHNCWEPGASCQWPRLLWGYIWLCPYCWFAFRDDDWGFVRRRRAVREVKAKMMGNQSAD